MVVSQALGHCISIPVLWQEAGSPLSTLEPCPNFGLCHVLNALVVTGALHTGQPGECCANNSTVRMRADVLQCHLLMGCCMAPGLLQVLYSDPYLVQFLLLRFTLCATYEKKCLLEVAVARLLVGSSGKDSQCL